MWFTFKLAFCIFITWHLIKWRFTLWRTRRRRRNRARVKQLTPSQAVERMTTKPNPNPVVIPVNDNVPPPPSEPNLIVVQSTTPQALPPKQNKPKQHNKKMINEVTSALINLGMTKRKAKQHVQQCYDDMNNTPSLTELLTYSIKSLST